MRQPANHISSGKEKYEDIKKRSKEAYQRTMEGAAEAEPAVADELREVQEQWTAHQEAEKEANENGGPMPEPSQGIASWTIDELRGDLATQTAKLDLNTQTNEDIVRQYENRANTVRRSVCWASFACYVDVLPLVDRANGGELA